MDSTVSWPDIIHSYFTSVACTPSCVYFILCHCITHLGSCVHHQSQETKVSIVRIPSAPLSQPGPLSTLPPSLTLLPVAFCHVCVCVCVCVCLKFLLSFHDRPASTLVPGTLWFKLLAAIRVLTESVGSAWEFFCLWNWQWNLRNAWGGKSNLTTLLLMSSLFQTYKRLQNWTSKVVSY